MKLELRLEGEQPDQDARLRKRSEKGSLHISGSWPPYARRWYRRARHVRSPYGGGRRPGGHGSVESALHGEVAPPFSYMI